MVTAFISNYITYFAMTNKQQAGYSHHHDSSFSEESIKAIQKEKDDRKERERILRAIGVFSSGRPS